MVVGMDQFSRKLFYWRGLGGAVVGLA